MPLNLLVPRYFLNQRMLGTSATGNWEDSDSWVNHYRATYDLLSRHHREIKLRLIAEDEYDLATHILGSQAIREHDTGEAHIRWSYSARRRLLPLQPTSSPFSVLSLFDERYRVGQNLVYGPNGMLLYCIDFADHSSADRPTPTSVHWHKLQPGAGLERNMRDGDHAFDWNTCPWVWLAIPTHDSTGNPLSVALTPGGHDYVLLSINYGDEAHDNPAFRTPPEPEVPVLTPRQIFCQRLADMMTTSPLQIQRRITLMFAAFLALILAWTTNWILNLRIPGTADAASAPRRRRFHLDDTPALPAAPLPGPAALPASSSVVVEVGSSSTVAGESNGLYRTAAALRSAEATAVAARATADTTREKAL